MALPDGCETLDSIDTGVPHVAASVLSLDAHPVLLQGRELRYHAAFQPGGTNANFYRVLGPNRIAVRTYERGVEDETLACGTGSIACALLASLRGWVSSPVEVLTRGGEVLVIHFRKGTNGKEPFEEVWLQGETSISCEGSLHEEAF